MSVQSFRKMKKKLLVVAASLLSGCIIQQPIPTAPMPTAQEIATQIERDYATQAQATPEAQPTAKAQPTAEATPSLDTEVPVSQEAYNQVVAKIKGMSNDQLIESISITLEGLRDFLKQQGNTDEEAGMVGLIAAWARDQESTHSQQLQITCTDDNIEWFQVIAKNLHDIASMPWTVTTKGNETEQEMAEDDALNYAASGFVDGLVKQCRKVNAIVENQLRQQHRHHQSSLPKGTHEL
jgi:hypothetical protein